MINRKINNQELWEKIRKLRGAIRNEPEFRKRTCWACHKELNIYDFLSDNLEFSVGYLMQLWQSRILEFHCCECFRQLKSAELKHIEEELTSRKCIFCDESIDFKTFSKHHIYLKIHELKQIWLNDNAEIFCGNICQRRYYQDKFRINSKKS
jgi:hypothetical protein